MAVLTDNLTEIALRAGRTPAAVAIPAFVLALNPVHPAPVTLEDRQPEPRQAKILWKRAFGL